MLSSIQALKLGIFSIAMGFFFLKVNIYDVLV